MSIISTFRIYREQHARVRAVLSWARKHLREDEVVVVSITGFASRYVMRGGGFPQIRSDNGRVPALIVCEPKDFSTLARVNKQEWKSIFRSPLIEVWENAGRFTNHFPARHGLSREDSTALLEFARKVLSQKIKRGEQPVPPIGFERFADDVISADVAVWVDGQLRASMIAANKPLVEAVTEAAIKAASDARFRPLETKELSGARLELALWSDLEIPLLPLEIAHGDIYHTKAYIARKEEKTGWYLPTVFNCIRFTHLTDLLNTLARDKGGFSPIGAQFMLAEVQGWIESSDRTKALRLRGPVVAENAITDAVCFSLPHIVECARRGADQLLLLQQPSGYIESTVDPFESRSTRSMQWERLALASYALALFGRSLKIPKYTKAASHLYQYLSKSLERSTLPDVRKIAVITYLGQAARILDKAQDMRTAADMVARKLLLLPYEPILYLQASTFLFSVGDSYQDTAKALYQTAAKQFLSQLSAEEPVSLAAYAELISLSSLFDDKEIGDRVERWYKGFQQADGSFPNTPDSSFSYTRGTGKIIEVMADDPERYQEQLGASISWMLDMQYGRGNIYFIPDKEKWAVLLGGFRHDAGNQQTWIDATAHFLIGVARLHARCIFG